MKVETNMYSIADIKEAVIPVATEYGLKRVYLFGSYAKGTATENSDVDLLIEKGAKLSLLGMSGIMQSVSESLKLPVDVITTVSLEQDEDMKKSVIGTEILLYEQDHK